VSRAARASVLWLAHAETTPRPPHRDARPHRNERDGGSSAVGTRERESGGMREERWLIFSKACMQTKERSGG
jgi:hypothetical protein